MKKNEIKVLEFEPAHHDLRPNDITVVQAESMHAFDISFIGRTSFYDSFTQLFKKQVELLQYLDYTYATEKIAVSIARPNNVFFIAFYNDEPVGFAKVKKQSANALVTGAKQMELQKIYTLKGCHGLGVGPALMQAVLQLAKKMNPAYLWLDVHTGNAKAIRFYEKNGFEKHGNHHFTIGTQDFEYDVMVLPIAATAINHSPFQINNYGTN